MVTPSWSSSPRALKDTIENVLGPAMMVEEITFRAMFGGFMAYTMGRPFASLSNAGIALKLATEDSASLSDGNLGFPLRYEPRDPPSKSYTVLPEESYGKNAARLESYLHKSIAHCQALPLKAKRRRSAKTPAP
jgi:TfoX/Sxy family transcriptional regulator of competence genes